MVEPQPSKLITGVRFSSSAPEMNLLELSSIMINIKFRNGFDFFCVLNSRRAWKYLKIILKERMVLIMIKFTTQELEIEKSLKQRIEFICEFCHIILTITNGSIKRINNTNLNYIEPYKIFVNNTTFLTFNYSNGISYLKSKINDLKSTLDYFKDKFTTLIYFLHRKLHSWYDKDDKYIDIVN